MRVVFVHPKVGFRGGFCWEAAGIGYIASYLRATQLVDYGRGDEVEFYSGFFDRDEEILRACREADIVGFSCTSPQVEHARQLASDIRLRFPGAVTVIGGVHASAWPEDEIKPFHIMVRGEGETAMAHLVQDWWNGQVKTVYQEPAVPNLAMLPDPDRRLIKNERNIAEAYRDNHERITSINAQRGCPYDCRFCCSRAIWGRRIRSRSPESVVSEMAYLVNCWRIQFVKFSDDTFTAKPRWVSALCHEKLDSVNRTVRDLPFGCNVQASTMTDRLAARLKEAGCREAWVGLESGSPRILREYHKATSVKKIEEAFKACKSHGIRTRAYIMLGAPTETRQDIKLTEKLIDRVDPDYVGVTLLAPFPGSDYYDHASMRNWDWSTFDEYGNDWVRTETLTNEDLKAEQERLYAKFSGKVVQRERKRRSPK